MSLVLLPLIIFNDKQRQKFGAVMKKIHFHNFCFYPFTLKMANFEGKHKFYLFVKI